MVHLSENLARKFIIRGSWIYLFAFLSGPLAYAIKIMISHDVSVNEVGILYSTLSLILLIGSLNDFGMVESLHYFIPKLTSEGKLGKVKAFLTYAFATMFTTSLLTGITLYFGANFLAEQYFGATGDTKNTVVTILQIFSVFLFVNNLQHYFSTVAYVHQNTFLAKGMDTFRLLISAGLGWFFFYGNGLNAGEYAMIWVYGAIPATLVGGLFAWKYHLSDMQKSIASDYNTKEAKELFAYSIWALLANNASLLLSQIDIQLVMKLAGTEQAGYYSNYISLISIPFLFVGPILTFLFPVISAYNGAKQEETIKTIVNTFTHIFLLAGVASTGVMFALGQELGTFFFTEKFAESGRILYWCLAFLACNFLLQINFNLLAAIGKVKTRLKIVSSGIVINIILNIILIREYGAAGSALAVGITWVFLWGLSYHTTREYHRPIQYTKQLINGICFGILGVAGYYGIQYFGISGNDRLHFLIYGLIILAIAASLFFGIHRKEVSYIIQTVKNRKKEVVQ